MVVGRGKTEKQFVPNYRSDGRVGGGEYETRKPRISDPIKRNDREKARWWWMCAVFRCVRDGTAVATDEKDAKSVYRGDEKRLPCGSIAESGQLLDEATVDAASHQNEKRLD